MLYGKRGAVYGCIRQLDPKTRKVATTGPMSVWNAKGQFASVKLAGSGAEWITDE